MFSGSLAEVGLPTVIDFLRGTRQTGALRIEDGDVVRNVYLKDGHPMFAVSSHNEPLIGDLLVKAGAISPGDLTNALAEQKKSKALLGEVLIKMKLVTPSIFQLHLRDQAEGILFQLLEKPSGNFQFEEKPIPFSDVLLFSRFLKNLFAQGMKDVSGLLEVHRKFPRSDLKVRKVDEFKVPADLAPEDQQIYSLIYGELSVGAVCAESPVSELKTLQAIIRLLSANLIEETTPQLEESGSMRTVSMAQLESESAPESAAPSGTFAREMEKIRIPDSMDEPAPDTAVMFFQEGLKEAFSYFSSLATRNTWPILNYAFSEIQRSFPDVLKNTRIEQDGSISMKIFQNIDQIYPDRQLRLVKGALTQLLVAEVDVVRNHVGVAQAVELAGIVSRQIDPCLREGFKKAVVKLDNEPTYMSLGERFFREGAEKRAVEMLSQITPIHREYDAVSRLLKEINLEQKHAPRTEPGHGAPDRTKEAAADVLPPDKLFERGANYYKQEEFVKCHKDMKRLLAQDPKYPKAKYHANISQRRAIRRISEKYRESDMTVELIVKDITKFGLDVEEGRIIARIGARAKVRDIYALSKDEDLVSWMLARLLDQKLIRFIREDAAHRDKTSGKREKPKPKPKPGPTPSEPPQEKREEKTAFVMRDAEKPPPEEDDLEEDGLDSFSRGLIAAKRKKAISQVNIAYNRMGKQNYFDLLGVRDGATSKQVKRAYLKKMEFCSPEALSNIKEADIVSKGKELFERYTDAYETLADPKSQRKYKIQIIKEKKVELARKEQANVHFRKGMEYYHNKNLAKAAECFEQAINIFPNNPVYYQMFNEVKEHAYLRKADSYYKRALVEYQKRNFDKAVENLDMAIQAAPKRQEFLDKMIEILNRIPGKKRDVEPYIVKKLENNPSDIDSLIEYGEYLMQIGNNDRAAVQFDRALYWDSSNDTAKITLKTLIKGGVKLEEAKKAEKEREPDEEKLRLSR